MKNKIIVFTICSTLLTACATATYKISDQNIKNYIESKRGLSKCLYPNLTNSAAMLSLSEDEKNLLIEYNNKLLSNIIGREDMNILSTDSKSLDYFSEKFEKGSYDKTISRKDLSGDECSAIKSKFHQELAERRIQQQQQQIAQAQREEQRRIDKAKADEFRAWYVGQMMSQDLKSRGNQHRVTVEYK